MRNILLLSLCGLIFFTMLTAGFSLKSLSTPITFQQDQTLEVLYGDSVHKVARKLQQQNIYPHPKLLIAYAKLFDMTNIKAGEYKLNSGDSVLMVLDNMVRGKVIQNSVTLLEGWTSKQAIEALQQTPGIVTTLDLTQPSSILAAVDAADEYQHIEGIFYPDTYFFSKGTKDRDILKIAYDKTQSVLQSAWQANTPALPYKNPYEVLIMASIIERETAIDAEREQIAGVFVERLLRGMKLQTDPTVIYGMGDSYQGNIRRKDLLTPTAYNTYTIKGLPPTPIALASEASIKAALNPLLNGMLYFVAKGDGYHQFSSNLADHQQAVRDYQLNRKKDYRSSPTP
ncbi:MAG: endolytic transglycosylase MltG [Pseudomonadales bacterium]|nr:endolytic transglycosylase MltG [Pseudomonadales bacterium]